MARFDGNWFFRDVIVGTNNADVIYGHGGDDELSGNGGNDEIYGGLGNDEISGGSGHDTLRGEWGHDIIRGGSGNDTIDGGDDDDTLYGGDDHDTIYGGNGSDWLYGDEGNDILSGGNHTDYLYGGTGNDTLMGGAATDYLHGEAGNDTFRDTLGNNLFNGGAGIDTADYSTFNGRIKVTLAEGNGEALADRDIMIYHVDSGTRYYDDGTDRFVSIENVNGGLGDDVITGNSSANVINGGGGRDIIRGGGGHDTLTGGTGQDFFEFHNGDAPMAVTLLNGTRLVDKITDFNRKEGDYIDLRPMDSTPATAVNNSFLLVQNFTGRAGELVVRQDSGSEFRLIGDTNGDGAGDMFIDVKTVGNLTMDQFMGGVLL